jgi:hypothetical protein
MGSHARRSASESKRWMNCPGSLRMSKDVPRYSSEYARLGTAAHAVGEHLLALGQRDASSMMGWVVGLDEAEDATIFKPGTPQDAQGDPRVKWWFVVDQNMVEALQVYLDVVAEEVARLGPMAECHPERRLSLEFIRPEMWGTSDYTIVLHFDELVIIDYKHGQGVPVEVEENEQLMYYAIGAAQDCGWCFEKATLVVVQPRCPHEDGPVRRWSTTKERLRQHIDALAKAADLTEDPFAPVVAGDWCGFCPAAAVCPVLKEAAFKAAQSEFEAVPFAPSPQTSPEELSQRMKAIPMLDAFIRAVEAEAARRLREGNQVPGFKLVRKRSKRKWADEKAAVEALKAIFPVAKLFKPQKPISPSQAEKLRERADGTKIARKEVLPIIAALSTKPEGGITVVDEHDPREAVDPSAAAMADFTQAEPGVDPAEAEDEG